MPKVFKLLLLFTFLMYKAAAQQDTCDFICFQWAGPVDHPIGPFIFSHCYEIRPLGPMPHIEQLSNDTYFTMKKFIEATGANNKRDNATLIRVSIVSGDSIHSYGVYGKREALDYLAEFEKEAAFKANAHLHGSDMVNIENLLYEMRISIVDTYTRNK